MEKFENKIEVSYGTNFVKEVDRTLDNLKNHNLVLSVEKNNGVDCIKYIIEFKDAEAAFLFGLSRPQIKGM
jgi:hypothetical protein